MKKNIRFQQLLHLRQMSLSSVKAHINQVLHPFTRNILYIVFVSLLFGCSDMNDKHDIYLKDGEDVYICKFDSLMIFPGNERVLLRFWNKDPRAKTASINWYPFNDSVMVTLNPRPDSTEVMIGGTTSNKTISEGSYTFNFITYDNLGNHSVPMEKMIKIYGQRYQASLSNRNLKKMDYDQSESSLILSFAGATTENEIGIELRYSKNGETTGVVFLDNEQLASPLKIENVDVKKGVSFRSVFLPEPNAIDTFRVDFTPVELILISNVALNKSVTVSDLYAENFIGANAVDGIVTNESRWVSSATGEHWIEIELGQEYNIFSFKTLIGAGGNFQSPVPTFVFQAEIDGEWENIVEVSNNTNPQFEASFPEVATSKVRYYVPDYAGNQVRLYEIEVYAKVKI